MAAEVAAEAAMEMAVEWRWPRTLAGPLAVTAGRAAATATAELWSWHRLRQQVPRWRWATAVPAGGPAATVVAVQATRAAARAGDGGLSFFVLPVLTLASITWFRRRFVEVGPS